MVFQMQRVKEVRIHSPLYTDGSNFHLQFIIFHQHLKGAAAVGQGTLHWRFFPFWHIVIDAAGEVCVIDADRGWVPIAEELSFKMLIRMIWFRRIRATGEQRQ